MIYLICSFIFFIPMSQTISLIKKVVCAFFTCIKLVAHELACARAIACIKCIRLLLCIFQELYSLIIKKAEMEGIKFSSLYRYIKSKKEYIQLSKIAEVSCLCTDCENMKLLCAGIKHACPEANLKSNCHELMDLIACKPITPACIDRSCQNCPTI